jgi:hypothetical protein
MAELDRAWRSWSRFVEVGQAWQGFVEVAQAWLGFVDLC